MAISHNAFHLEPKIGNKAAKMMAHKAYLAAALLCRSAKILCQSRNCGWATDGVMCRPKHINTWACSDQHRSPECALSLLRPWGCTSNMWIKKHIDHLRKMHSS